MPTTARGAIPYPLLTDPSDVPADMKKLADRVAAIIAMDAQGPLGSRPAAGNAGSYYTDPATGITSRDDGVAWHSLNDPTAAPPGIMLPYGGDTAPGGWLICDGRAISRATYAALFGVLGSKYGAGDGTTTFNLPDLQGRVPIGPGSGRVLGDKGGVETVTLTGAQIPAHNHGGATGSDPATHNHVLTDPGHAHTISDPGHAHGISDPGHAHGVNDPGHLHQSVVVYGATGAGAQAVSYEQHANAGNYPTLSATTGISIGAAGTGIGIYAATTGVSVVARGTGVTLASASVPHTHAVANDGGGGSHTNMQPYTVVNYIIKF